MFYAIFSQPNEQFNKVTTPRSLNNYRIIQPPLPLLETFIKLRFYWRRSPAEFVNGLMPIVFYSMIQRGGGFFYGEVCDYKEVAGDGVWSIQDCRFLEN